MRSELQEVQEIKQEKSIAEKVKNVIGMQEAYAMPVVPLPTLPESLRQVNPAFLNYINQPVNSNSAEKKPSREEFEQLPLYRVYYFVDDKKKEFKEKYMTVNFDKKSDESIAKEKKGVKALKSDVDEDSLGLKLDFHEYRGRKKFFEFKLEEPWKGNLRLQSRCVVYF